MEEPRTRRRPGPAETFAALHHRVGRPFVLPNAWDVTSALLLADAGFPAIGTTSLGVNAAAGSPDGDGDGADRAVELARRLVPRLPVPLTVDLENGYHDDAATIAALGAELAALGVAGINLEDGRADGRLRTPDEQAAIIGAVVAAAPGLFVNARTDTYWLRTGADENSRFDETLHRLTRYRAAGASGVFVPGLTDPGRIGVVTAAVPLPLNILWYPGADLAGLGAVGVARVSTGSALYRHALAAALSTAAAARTGAVPPVDPVDYHRIQERLHLADGATAEPGGSGTVPGAVSEQP
ncbi:isocitrate lyase/phosphoenolpyruvate mutase family protein [Plantactinospora sp. B5E13]|uniref:isocitrate lyase/PEP mutase family protein n=1 Tax=unclassified Plantactinospora TaxID=2631981 RepID=UPI00325EF34A